MIQLSPIQARALHLAAQGLERPARRRATKADVLATIQRMGALQIDTINIVARSPYLVLFSRLGNYQNKWLDELLEERRIFEYWAHEACFLPIEDYALFRHRMLEPETMGWKYHANAAHKKLEPKVLDAIRERGPVRSSDFERRDGKKGGWWQWKGEKRVLENLFTAGEVMIARRHNFQRVYDLRERVLPDWRDEHVPERLQVDRELALKAVKALGIAQARWVADYYRMSKRGTPAIVEQLAQEGELLRANVEGWKTDAFVHPDHADAFEQAASGKLKSTVTTLLSPFDPVVWDRARAQEMFGFDYRLECYTPEPKRKWGYFVLPILRKGALIGRLDAKAHRQQGIFEVKKLFLEDGVRSSEALAADISSAIQSCADWHGTPDIAINSTAPAALRKML